MMMTNSPLLELLLYILTLTGANAIIVIVGAVIAAVLLHYDVDKLTITGDIKSGLPPFKLPAFTLDYTEKNGTESIHKSFGNILGVSVIIALNFECRLL